MVNVTVNAELANFGQLALKELQIQVYTQLLGIKNRIEESSKEILRLSFYDSRHYISLLNGELQIEFGLEDPGPMLKTIIDAIIASVQIEEIPPNKDFLGGIVIKAIKSDFSDALSANGSAYISSSSRGNKIIPWLEWLLFAGDKVLLGDYSIFQSSRVSNWSRTGEAIMIERNRGSKLPSWRVPPKYAGTIKDNWLTEVAENTAPKILQLFEKELKRIFNV